METLKYGIDVSSYQSPSQILTLKGQIDFVIVKASEGIRHIDSRAVEHVKAAREIGVTVGLYHFFHDEDPRAQFDLFRVVADRCGYKDGDLIPGLDIEDYAGKVVIPKWSDAAEALAGFLSVEYGDVMPYISKHMWVCLGSPAWVIDLPLWVPQYARAQRPATPGDRPAVIWQHRSAPFVHDGPAGDFDPKNPMSIDQNRVLSEVPRMKRRDLSPITDADRERVLGLVANNVAQEIRDTEPERIV